jgi:hypothetical protein
MLSLGLVLVLTSALAGDLSPEELIGRLGSPDRVVREEAARTLEEQGAEALPVLRAAHALAKGPEDRERLADLIARIEARSLDRSTMVVFDVDDRPLGEAVLALATCSGFSLSLDDPALASRRITVRASGPVPFWEAVDRLGRAGHVRHDPGPRSDATGDNPRASAIRLVAGEPPAPTAYSGPLRIHLFATHRHRDVNFEVSAGNDHVSRRSATVTVEIQAFAEPGRFIDPNGLPRLEAVDEHGRAISRQPAGGGDQPNPSEHSWLRPGRLSLLHWHIPLGLPDPPVRSPFKLRGVLPVVISSRRPSPLVIPLADAAGKTFHQGVSVVRIENVSNPHAKTTEFNLVLSEDASPTDRTRVSEGREKDYIGDFLRNRIEFEDVDGHPMSWLLMGDHPVATTNGELRALTSVSGIAPPAAVHVYRLRRLATEIPFELGDVPSP